jgi:uncharacterized protein YraI
MARCVFEQLTPGSSSFKMAFLVILATWAMVLTGLSGCVVQVVPSATPTPSAPGIALDPVAGPIGTLVTVRGVGWSSGGTVSIYLVAPGQEGLPPSVMDSVAVDAVGNFETRLLIPTLPDWDHPGPALVVATQFESGASAQAIFNVTGLPEAPTATVAHEPSPSPAKITDTISTPSEPATPVGTATTHLNVRAGPGTGYPILGELEPDQSVEITGVSPDGSWWQIRFAGAADGRGWVSAAYVAARNTENVPIIKPPPTSPTPVAITDWRGEYYNSRDPSGVPVLVRNDAAVNFDWGAGAPATGMLADNFSVCWSRDVSTTAGTYRFYVHVDDGVRLWVDETILIDGWHDGLNTYTADIYLADGTHSLRLECYEHTGNALAQLAWERPDSYPDWKGEYFNNPSLSGVPVLVRNDPGISFDWGPDSPGPGVPADNFSARWSRNWQFEAGDYRFRVVVDDGARLWVDDELVIDRWRAGEPKGYAGEITLDEGTHSLRLEYFEFQYDAQVHLSWEQVD